MLIDVHDVSVSFYAITTVLSSFESEWLYRSDTYLVQFSKVQLFATPWIAAHQASLSITNSQSPLKLMSIKSVMPCSHLILCHPLLLPQSFLESGSFPMRQLFTLGGQSIGVSALASVLPMNTQDWSPLGWTGWISLQPKGPSRVLLSHPYMTTGKT